MTPTLATIAAVLARAFADCAVEIWVAQPRRRQYEVSVRADSEAGTFDAFCNAADELAVSGLIDPTVTALSWCGLVAAPPPGAVRVFCNTEQQP